MVLSAISLVFPKRNTVTFPFPPGPLSPGVLRTGRCSQQKAEAEKGEPAEAASLMASTLHS